MNKDLTRNEMKAKRKSLSKEFISTASQAITDTVLNLDIIKNSQCIMLYLSAFNEPDTSLILSELWRSGKMAVVPVSDTDSFTITPSVIASASDLEKGAYGIYEPKEIVPISPSAIDAVIVPAVAFSKNGDRLGFGKGYYDKFLSEFAGVKIGIGYEFQVVDTLPTDEHDIKMDLIITEKRIYNDF